MALKAETPHNNEEEKGKGLPSPKNFKHIFDLLVESGEEENFPCSSEKKSLTIMRVTQATYSFIVKY